MEALPEPVEKTADGYEAYISLLVKKQEETFEV